MKALFVGVAAASVFGLLANLLPGQEGRLTDAWMDVVFWTLIGAGAALKAVDLAWECLPCHISRLFHWRTLIERLCGKVPCGH